MIEFLVEGWNPPELCSCLYEWNFMIRPEAEQQLPAPARISTGFCNTLEGLELLAEAIRETVR